MFCSECGKEAAGKFCWNCGSLLHAPSANASATGAVAAPATVPMSPAGVSWPGVSWPGVSWEDDIDYERLLRIPEVGDRLAKVLSRGTRMTGEEFAETFGKIIGAPASAGQLMPLLQELYGRLGIHTGKARRQAFSAPTGRVIVAALCTLARCGYKVSEARQASDGCVLVCEIPSDMFSLKGQLLVAFRRGPGGTEVEASTRIEGQLFDWGKSKRCLEEVFQGISSEA